MNRITVPFEIKQVQNEGEFFTFSGYASTFGNVDLGDDVIMPGAFAESLKEMTSAGDILPIIWQHNSMEPVGVYPIVREDEKGLYVEGKMPKSDTFVSGRVIPQMQVGSVRKMSIGYSSIDDEMTDGGRIRRIKKIKLWEASLVSIPMNNEANIISMKAAVPFQNLPLAERSRPWDSGLAIARVRALTGSEDAPSADYKKAFLWYDNTAPDNFGSYKLPIADVIFDRMRAVPRAIFSAAAAMSGARGGVDIPESDRAGVIANINRYYEKLDLESPFQGKGFRIDDFNSLDPRTLEKMLSGGVSVSRKAAKTIVSLIESSDLRDAGQKGQRDVADWDDVMSSINETKTIMEDGHV